MYAYFYKSQEDMGERNIKRNVFSLEMKMCNYKST